jgi:peptidoglycan hydrolase-like protein with peptidoglycan-binding domain
MASRRTLLSRADRSREEDDHAASQSRWPVGLLRRLGWGAREAVAIIAGAGAAVVIVVNALFLQSGPHPAPFFKSSSLPLAVPAETTSTVAVAMPRPRPPELTAPKIELQAISRIPAETLAEIQRELGRRGFYDGPIDGMHGPKTDSAIRDFEQAAGLKPGAQQNEALLQAIVKSSPELARLPRPPAPVPPRNDAIADLLVPGKRVMAVQRALAQFGYGQIKPTGIVDAETRSAIEKFERDHKLPVTGQPSDRLARELAVATGRSLD